jgi:glycosyltransferase involved in cell wall biosynthesis
MTASPKPRVLHLTSTARIGGTERNVLRLFENRGDGLFDYAVAAMEPEGPFLDAARSLGVPVWGLPSPHPLSLATRRRLLDIMRGGSFQIVHAYGLRADILGRPLARRAGVPRFVSAIRSPDPWRRLHHVLLDRLTARYWPVDLFISNSEAGKRSRVEREKFPPDRIVVIPNGVEIPQGPANRQFRPSPEAAALRRSLGLPTDAGPLIAVVSNLRPAKGHIDMIEALARVVGSFPKALALMAGRDDSAGAIPALARAKGLADSARFLGYVPDPLPLMRLCDVYCMPSHWEGCPTALMEAMALACPVVATRVGGIPEILDHERTGLLCPAKNPESLAEALLRLLDNEKLAESLAQAARKEVENRFTLERMIQEIEQNYTRLLRP